MGRRLPLHGTAPAAAAEARGCSRALIPAPIIQICARCGSCRQALIRVHIGGSRALATANGSR
jgi:hypothetical protein